MPQEDDDDDHEDARREQQDAGLSGQGKKDIEVEVRALISKARSRLEGVRTTMDDNGQRLKTMQKGFKDLKKQQAHFAKEQQQAIGQLQNGLQT
mmetsp:Transcript_974/g.773  ORF Transcript_974/g.773 Transcript_974/m.773 type:complete len:94 (+) Transcript_974:71-352(+)